MKITSKRYGYLGVVNRKKLAADEGKKKTKIERKYKHDIGKEIEFLSDKEVLLINSRRSIDSFGFSLVVLKRKSLMSVVLS